MLETIISSYIESQWGRIVSNQFIKVYEEGEDFEEQNHNALRYILKSMKQIRESEILKEQYNEEIDEYMLNRSPYLSDRNTKDRYSHLKFINMKTWHIVRDILLQKEEAFDGMFQAAKITHEGEGRDSSKDFNTPHNDPVTFPEPSQVERLLNAFKYESEALFMITRPPKTTIPLLVTEIGTCTLKVDDKFRGVPTVEYRTSKGVVRLFAHEVTPASDSLIEDNIRCGSYYIEDGTRLIPSFEQYGGIADTFGRLLNMPLDVEGLAKEYEEVSGNNPLL